MFHTRTPELGECIRNCEACADACERALERIDAGGRAYPPWLRPLVAECGSLCATASGFLWRGSRGHEHVTRVCAGLCEVCAEQCEREGRGELALAECARAARECTEVCRATESVAA